MEEGGGEGEVKGREVEGEGKMGGQEVKEAEVEEGDVQCVSSLSPIGPPAVTEDPIAS